MDQIRIVVAVALSIIVFLAWDYFFIPDVPPPPAPQQTVEAIPEETRVSGQAPLEQARPPAPRQEVVPEAKSEKEENWPKLVVETNLYTAELSGSGACFTGFELKKYREDADDGAAYKRLVSEKNRPGTGCVDFVESGASENSGGFYVSEPPSGVVAAGASPQALSFFRRVNGAVIIEKRYTFYPDSYAIDLDVVLKNASDSPVTGRLGVSLNRYFSGKESRFLFEGPCAFKDGRLEEVKLDDINETRSVSGSLSWIAIQSRYFMSAVIPEQTEEAAMALAYGEDGVVTAQYRPTVEAVLPQTSAVYHFTMYMGPKDLGILKGVGRNLDKAVDFGWFDVIARPCLWLMNQIYRIVPNYGLSIIIVTLIIKLMFWPLGTKSYKSMGEMKKIQPLMAEIREKYKNDRKKMNEEMMGLYKTYKVNPLGGCLPMLVQIPVFIAFYRMLYQAIELRHAPFLLWINDLAAPERLFSFDVSIPFMQPPTGIPVLTILMGATMFLQQKMQPPPGDPSQAKIMMLMPIFLTVIFINFPSGLVLYFIVNNLFSIFQQHYTTRTKA